MDNPPPPDQFSGFWIRVIYYAAAVALSGLSSFTKLLGSKAKLSARVVTTYLLCGALVGGGIVLLFEAKFGRNAYLMGMALFAGYTALDIIAIVSVAIGRTFAGWLSVEEFQKREKEGK